MSCCTNDLGLKPHNQDINLGLDAEQDGEYKFILDFNGVKTTKKQTVEIGDDLILPRPFNEDFIYTMQIIRPDGTLLVVDDCDTFIFKTYIAVGECEQGACQDEETETYS